eukprot:755619-Amphidinium_carterae.1
MRDIEIAVQSPTASPEFILELVGNMTAHAGHEPSAPKRVHTALTATIKHIALQDSSSFSDCRLRIAFAGGVP